MAGWLAAPKPPKPPNSPGELAGVEAAPNAGAAPKGEGAAAGCGVAPNALPEEKLKAEEEGAPPPKNPAAHIVSTDVQFVVNHSACSEIWKDI